MRFVIEFLRCERAYRDLAAKVTNPDDKLALELMAAGWARRAAERLRKLEEAAAPLTPLRVPPAALRNKAAETLAQQSCGNP